MKAKKTLTFAIIFFLLFLGKLKNLSHTTITAPQTKQKKIIINNKVMKSEIKNK